jgi:hypothetical protein
MHVWQFVYSIITRYHIHLHVSALYGPSRRRNIVASDTHDPYMCQHKMQLVHTEDIKLKLNIQKVCSTLTYKVVL